MSLPNIASPSVGWAWLAATIVLAIHVADEATHDFLAWYNPQALRIRRFIRLPFPPTFTFLPWLAGLIVGIAVLGALTPAAFAGATWMRPLAYVVAGIHIANGLGHLVGSVVVRRVLPGAISAPLLLASGIWLGFAASGLG